LKFIHLKALLRTEFDEDDWNNLGIAFIQHKSNLRQIDWNNFHGWVQNIIYNERVELGRTLMDMTAKNVIWGYAHEKYQKAESAGCSTGKYMDYNTFLKYVNIFDEEKNDFVQRWERTYDQYDVLHTNYWARARLDAQLQVERMIAEREENDDVL